MYIYHSFISSRPPTSLMAQQASSTRRTTSRRTKNTPRDTVPAFVQKTYKYVATSEFYVDPVYSPPCSIVSDSKNHDVIRWSDSGESFLSELFDIWHPAKTSLLPSPRPTAAGPSGSWTMVQARKPQFFCSPAEQLRLLQDTGPTTRFST